MEQKTIKLGIDVKSKNHKFKAVYAIRELRRQIQKHFKGVNFRIDNSLNEYFWKEGKTDNPTKVEITTVKEGNELTAFLAGSPNLEAHLNKDKAKKTEKVAAPKEEKTQSEPKEEVKAPKKTEKKTKKSESK